MDIGETETYEFEPIDVPETEPAPEPVKVPERELEPA
jgi:hypothetical protein